MGPERLPDGIENYIFLQKCSLYHPGPGGKEIKIEIKQK